MVRQIRDNLRNYFTLSKFLLFTKNQLIKTEICSDLLFSYLDKNPIVFFSNWIQRLKDIDRVSLDLRLLEKDFWENPANQDFVYFLKVAWLIKDLNRHGQRQPIQLISKGDGKYRAHPGSARSLVLSYLVKSSSITVFYVWDKRLDPIPFFIGQNYEKIKYPAEFLGMFDGSRKNLRIKHCLLTTDTDCRDGSKFNYFKLAQQTLNGKDSTLDLITVYDTAHWSKYIIGKIFFRDVINFTDNNTAELCGIRFTKRNDLWIVDDSN